MVLTCHSSEDWNAVQSSTQTIWFDVTNDPFLLISIQEESQRQSGQLLVQLNPLKRNTSAFHIHIQFSTCIPISKADYCFQIKNKDWVIKTKYF